MKYTNKTQSAIQSFQFLQRQKYLQAGDFSFSSNRQNGTPTRGKVIISRKGLYVYFNICADYHLMKVLFGRMFSYIKISIFIKFEDIKR